MPAAKIRAELRKILAEDKRPYFTPRTLAYALHTMRERVWLYKRKGELPPYDFCVTCRAKGWLRETLVKFSETPTPRQLKKWGFPESLTPEDFTPEQREEIKNKLNSFQ